MTNFPSPSISRPDLLQENLIDWFTINKRTLPFRQTKDPYPIWISEIMAQQTQIDTLIPYFNRFIKKFPSVESLASASEDAVFKAWEGLGYYSRARNLHKAAKLILSKYNGEFPSNYKDLLELPGIGPYTGGAIASIAYNEAVTAVDGNVLRVVSRYTNSWLDISQSKTKKIITSWLQTILPPRVGDFNQALMELGALICTPKNPHCLLCPICSGCQAFDQGTQDKLPIKKKKTKPLIKQMEVGIISQNNAWFLIKRAKKGLLSNMWAFPIVEATTIKGESINSYLKNIFPDLQEPVLIGQARHVFSHLIWEMDLYYYDQPCHLKEAKSPYQLSGQEDPEAFQKGLFLEASQIKSLALPIAFSKLIPIIIDSESL